MRSPVTAAAAGLVVAAIGAVILGEYELVGYRPLAAGALFGAAIAEAMATVVRRPDAHVPDPYLIAAAALVAEAGLVWALSISTGHRLDLASVTAWAGVAVGSAVAAMWLRSAGRRGGRTQAG